MHFEIAVAITAHLAWKTKVRNFIRTREVEQVCTDSHECQLGKWLDKDGKAFFKSDHVFKRLYDLHADVHKYCKDIVFNPDDTKAIELWEKKSDELLAMLEDLKKF